jgi:flagellar hook assembly protein FlgD
LLGVFPNPTRAGGTIRFTLDRGAAAVAVQIYDVAGRLIRDLGSEIHQAGLHEVRWDGRNNHGQDAPAGLYFVRVAAGIDLVQNTKVLVVR